MDKVTTAQIHPETARSKLLRTGKQTDGKTPSVFFVGLPSPRLRGHYFDLVCRREGQNVGARLMPQRVLTISVPRSLWGAELKISRPTALGRDGYLSYHIWVCKEPIR